MKNHLNILLVAVAIVLTAGVVVSCSDDDLDATIFNTDPSQDYLDRTQATFPLDTFIKANYLEPYNVQFIYRYNDKGTDMTKNLTPASYDKSVDLAVLTKYLWYDVYNTVSGSQVFLKTYSPRIIQLTGSKNYNPSQGTEVLGDASSGVKINFYNVNNLNVSDISMMNEYFFKTMHHEFAHILDQTYLHPTSFNTLSQGHYDASGWSDRPDSLSAGSGFTSSYASSSYTEDWAETMANYITRDTVSWQNLLNTASYDWDTYELGGSDDYNDSLIHYNQAEPTTIVTAIVDGQEITQDVFWLIRGNIDPVYTDATGRQFMTNPNATRDSIYYNLREHGVSAFEVMGYLNSTTGGKYNIYRKMIARDANGFPIPTADWGLSYTHTSGIVGSDVILQKVELVRNYLQEHYNLSLDALRKEVQTRTYITNSDGSFVYDQYGDVMNKLTQVQSSGQTLIDELRQQVYQFNSLVQH